MTTPLDRDLAERLERLAAAVPVRAGQLDPVHVGAVRARQQVRMRWLTPVVCIVALVLIAGALGLGSLGILNDPVSATTRSGDFELTIRSAKSHYQRGEPIEMSATLTYAGSEPSVHISHASSPMAFGIVEPVQSLLLNGMWAQSCGGTELQRGVGHEEPFRKSFGSPTELTPEALSFVRQPRLVLPPGTWHPYVIAEFSRGDCGSRSRTISMRAEIEIDVMDGPTWVDPSVLIARPTAAPSPTPVPEEIAIHLVNLDSEPVEVVFRNEVIAFLACGESKVVSVWELESAPLYTFIFRNGIRGRVGAATIDWGFPAGIVLRDGVVLSGPWPISYGPATSCDAEVEPSRTPEPASAAPDRTPIELATFEKQGTGGLDLCPMARGGGTLTRNPRTGLGFTVGIGPVLDVVWPQGYTAWIEGGVAVLRDAAGTLVAREGDRLVAGGGFTSEGPWYACSFELASPRDEP